MAQQPRANETTGPVVTVRYWAGARAAAEPFTFERQVAALEAVYKRIDGRNR